MLVFELATFFIVVWLFSGLHGYVALKVMMPKLKPLGVNLNLPKSAIKASLLGGAFLVVASMSLFPLYCCADDLERRTTK